MIPSIFLINQILTNHVTSAVNSAQSVQTADLTPLFLLIGIIGGCITLTLSYVSWLKYKAEKRIRKKEHK